MSEPRRQLATIMFTDMVGYSALTQENESLALALLEEHRQILRALFAQHSGREVDAVGDGFFVEFGSALDAAECAVAIQKALAERNTTAGAERRIHVRIGLHLGDVVFQDGRVQGDGVNVAARIEPLAPPGGICLSEDVARQIQNKLDFPLRKIGTPELKNIRLPVQIYRVVLPWERSQLPLLERARFGLKRMGPRLTLGAAVVLVVVVLVAVVAGQMPGQQPTEPTTSELPRNRLAVLPFANLSADAENEYFADGITEELISRLSRVSGLEVIARTSIMTYKGASKKIDEIGRELNVGTVLEGSVRKAENRVRITAQLIQVDNQAHLWSQDYERELSGIFRIQNEIAQHVADALSARLQTVDPRTLGPERGTMNLAAYDAYLLGLSQHNRYTPEGFDSALAHFEQAILADPGYAKAYAMLASTYDNLGYFGFRRPNEVYPLAKVAVSKALELDDTNAVAYTMLGNIKAYYDFDWPGAERAYKAALQRNPTSAIAHFFYGIAYLSPLGRHEEAIAAIKRALELDPLSLYYQGDLTWAYRNARRPDEAIAQARKALQMDPNLFNALWGLGAAYIDKQMYEEAIATFQKMVDATDGWSSAKSQLAWAYAASGRTEQARKLLAELQAGMGEAPMPSLFLAWPYVALGENDRAFEILNRAYDERSGSLEYMRVDQGTEPVHSDPRFAELLRKVGLQDE